MAGINDLTLTAMSEIVADRDPQAAIMKGATELAEDRAEAARGFCVRSLAEES